MDELDFDNEKLDKETVKELMDLEILKDLHIEEQYQNIINLNIDRESTGWTF